MGNNETNAAPDEAPPAKRSDPILDGAERNINSAGTMACVMAVVGLAAREPAIAALCYFAIVLMVGSSFLNLLPELRARSPTASERRAILTALCGFAPLLVPLGLWLPFPDSLASVAFAPLAVAWSFMAIYMSRRPPGRWRRPFFLTTAACAALGLFLIFRAIFG